MKRAKTLGLVVHRAEVVSGHDYHFLIDRLGQVQTLVPQEDVGEHAVAYNKTTIGIAIFGDFAAAEKGRNYHPTAEQIIACLNLICKLRMQYGALWVAGHSELGIQGTRYLTKLQPGHTCPGENFPLASIIAKSGALSFPKTTVGAKIS